MAHGPRYTVKYRRRREGKTDYRKRLRLLKSRLPRLVVRRGIWNFTVQLIEYDENGDKTIFTIHSKHLYKKYKWLGHRGNISTAYLVGLVAGFEALKRGYKEAVLDIGRHSPTKGSSVFAVLKGALDAGLHIPHSPDKIPSDDRIKGKHIENYAKYLLKNDPERYKKQFSNYIKLGLKPEEFSIHFEEIKNKILEEYKK
ncbi:MAG: 50S ribosomal protein L18 [Nanopusillaceae archaeon]